MTGHVADHNAIAGQLPELWTEIGELQVSIRRQTIALIVLDVLVAAIAILMIIWSV
jgi:hypothetical protein